MILREVKDMSMKPRIGLTEAQMKEEYGSVALYHRAWIVYISSHYNPVIEQVDQDTANATAQRPGHRECDEILENYKCFQQLQGTKLYGHLFQGSSGRTNPTPWLNGGKSFSMIEKLSGSLDTFFGKMKVTVESLDNSTLTERQNRIKLATIKQRILPHIQDLRQETGIELAPEAGSGMNVDDFLKAGGGMITNEIEELYLNLLTDAENKAQIKSKVVAAVQGSLVAKYAALHVRYREGRIAVDRIPAEFLIRETTSSDIFGSADQFRGFVQWLTPDQAALTFYLDKEEREHLIEKTSAEQMKQTDISGFSWRPGGAQAQTVACVTGYWIDLMKEKDADGKETRETAILRKATVIGDCIIKDFGEDTDIVFQIDNKTLPEIPIMVLYPNIVRGFSRCPMDRNRFLQEESDAIRHKIMQTVSRAKGRKHLIRGSKLTMGTSDLVNELEANDVTVIQDATEDNIIPGRDTRMTETIDMTLDPNVHRLYELRKMQDDEIEGAVGASALAMANVPRYVSPEQQRNALQQSTNAMHAYFSGGAEFYRRVSRRVVELCQIALADPDYQAEAETCLSADQITLLKRLSQENMQTLGMRIDIEDVIDEANRSTLIQQGLAMAQNVEVTGWRQEDSIRLINARTYTELINYFQQRSRQIEAEKKQNGEMERMAAQISEMRAAQSAEQTQNNELNARQQELSVKTTADLAGKMIQAESKQSPESK